MSKRTIEKSDRPSKLSVKWIPLFRRKIRCEVPFSDHKGDIDQVISSAMDRQQHRKLFGKSHQRLLPSKGGTQGNAGPVAVQEWDGWLRRRYRCYIWKQWKKPKRGQRA